jgi:hypothetical protein
MSGKKPIQSDAQVLGDVGENTVQLILKKFGWTADLIRSDFGEDIDCNIFIDNLRTYYHLRCQVKSTKKNSKYIKVLKNGEYSVPIRSGLLKAWISSYFPVFLIVYDQDSDLCYWTLPVKQILKTPSKLEKDKPVIRVSKNNIFNYRAKEKILKEVMEFYRKILRLNESIIECNIIPVLMPNYRVIPFYNYSEFLHNEGLLKTDFTDEYLDLLPSWMTVLKRLEPSNKLASIKLSSKKTDLNNFIDNLKQQLKTFNYPPKNNEWISFVVSPIKIISNKSTWISELTYWTSYTKFDDDVIVSDYNYNFEMPHGFLRPISRRAKSWDSYHSVHPQKDIAVQFLGSCELTPSIKSIELIHDKNIKGQLILWECNKTDIDRISDLISHLELTIKIIEDNSKSCLVAITTPIFNPFIGLYHLAADWDSFESGSVRNKLDEHNLLSVLPGNEYTGKIPKELENALNKHANSEEKKALVTEIGYISGFPLIHDERQIQVSRFQMVKAELINDVKARLIKINSIDKNDFKIDFNLQDDLWPVSIYELAVSWMPDINVSSKDDFLSFEAEILKIFNEILPTNNEDSLQLKNTFEILHIAGEIGFENIED